MAQTVVGMGVKGILHWKGVKAWPTEEFNMDISGNKINQTIMSALERGLFTEDAHVRISPCAQVLDPKDIFEYLAEIRKQPDRVNHAVVTARGLYADVLYVG